MREDFLHFVWMYQLFDVTNAQTINPEIRVEHPGFYNHHEGPDFLHARVDIGGIAWAGHVEIHVKSSDWQRHQHDDNPHYRNVILHVVWENDTDSFSNCPTLSLKGCINDNIREMYAHWCRSERAIPCAQSGLPGIPDIYRIQWLDRLIIERCEARYHDWQETFSQVQQNWRQMMWVKLAESFGMKYNKQGFHMLAMHIPVSTLDKVSHDPHLLEALLFGVSGLIPDTSDEAYVVNMKKHFQHISHRFSLMPIAHRPWRFLRMRPAAFPTLRLSQLAQVIYNSPGITQNLLSWTDYRSLAIRLNQGTSAYWDTHYTFQKSSVKKRKTLGSKALHNIIINTIIPLHYFHGKMMQDRKSITTAFRLLQETPAEENHITRLWRTHEHVPQSAYDSQAYIQLYNQYCINKKCVHCQFGQKLLKH